MTPAQAKALAAKLRKEAKGHDREAARCLRDAAQWLRDAAKVAHDFDSASSRTECAHQFITDAYVHLGTARGLRNAAVDLEEGQ